MAIDQEKINELSFEDSIEKLREIVSDIETGKVGLEESLSQYEAGMNLIKHCREILQKCEDKVEKLTD
ncbi:exodeoxyribonuclease VII small subunit [Sedimentisphaera salicampi]|uniref:Exodeoxyribonuclease 7 small subunit n=1 Tax=Sedimentisphaera salicampi TaxID=1941349 RepID=A0A1W6LJM2_9BACT|nr:exodeoxyribonuclease VII small subunit [Sedimentisphaera salicampi]ARN55981.1 Exodeoxyribonuclease 7 small subunit [Sedimentisphaera salicampi]OXU15897.1 Exodeoxyribonuclease 7 small subunit [Sedimentisphaera salicampi]